LPFSRSAPWQTSGQKLKALLRMLADSSADAEAGRIRDSDKVFVYQIHNATHEIYIHVVADGRRNFVELLKKRLLNPASKKNKKRTSFARAF
jgi:hypothetical protein